MCMDTEVPVPQFHENPLSLDAGNFENNNESESLLLFDIQQIIGFIIFPA